MSFSASHPALARALLARDYTEATSVQSAVLKAADSGRDLLVSAQTGSGKTVAYGLALAPTLLGGEEHFERARRPLALVVAPTRELAMQVQRELTWLYEHTSARVICCVGGTDARFEQRAIQAGAHIVVGTPGRLRDHVERGNLDFSELRAVTLDEADEMLDLGFREDLEFLLNQMPDSRRTLLFSATIAPEIAALARQFQQDALRIDTVARHVPHADIEYRAVMMGGHEIEDALVNVLRHEDSRASIVFCGTRDNVRRLHANLEKRGFSAVALSGELSQTERTYALEALRDGRARICVATDVAARGLDLPDLALVVHADLPTDRDILLHRSGRTGRAGRKGGSVVMVAHSKRRRAEMLIRQAGVQCSWTTPPTASDIRALDQERLLADPILTERPEGEEAALARKLLEGRSAEDVAAALIRLYRARLPAPADNFDAMPRFTQQSVGREPSVGREQRDAAPPRERRMEGFTGAGWFRVNVGRQQNADPKWLLPFICRSGDVTRAEIGAIRVFDRETKFEIAADALAHFREAVAAAGEQEFRIMPAEAPTLRDAEARAPGPHAPAPRNYAPRVEGKKPFYKGGPGGFKGKRRAG